MNWIYVNDHFTNIPRDFFSEKQQHKYKLKKFKWNKTTYRSKQIDNQSIDSIENDNHFTNIKRDYVK